MKNLLAASLLVFSAGSVFAAGNIPTAGNFNVLPQGVDTKFSAGPAPASVTTNSSEVSKGLEQFGNYLDNREKNKNVKAIPEQTPTPQESLPMSLAKLKLGGQEITVLIAETEEQRKQGLMNVKNMDENNGMIFSYGAPVEKACMWMKDTKIPLDVAFINGEGKIVNIEADMKPLSTDSHCNTAGPIYYALEMNAGWFAKNGVKPGDSLSNE